MINWPSRSYAVPGEAMSAETDLDKKPLAVDARLSETVPVIDIAELVERPLSAGARPVADIAAACASWGFFQVVGHGISPDLTAAVRGNAQAFFALPAAEKEVILRSRDNPWGYYNNELTKNQRDKKEVFDFTTPGSDPVYGAENRWPAFDACFRTVMEDYRDACTQLALRLLEAMSAGLGVDAAHLNEHFDPDHSGFVRLNHYPVKDPLEGRDDFSYLDVANLGVHHHTDAGALTVLLQDDVGGLQVFNGGYWHDVVPIPHAFVINTGDMMQVWSNDRYRAAIHRVQAMHARDRYSVPFFYNPNAGARVSPLPSVVSEAEPARYRSIDWTEFRARRTDGDYADYGPEVQISQYRIQ